MRIGARALSPWAIATRWCTKHICYSWNFEHCWHTITKIAEIAQDMLFFLSPFFFFFFWAVLHTRRPAFLFQLRGARGFVSMAYSVGSSFAPIVGTAHRSIRLPFFLCYVQLMRKWNPTRNPPRIHFQLKKKSFLNLTRSSAQTHNGKLLSMIFCGAPACFLFVFCWRFTRSTKESRCCIVA